MRGRGSIGIRTKGLTGVVALLLLVSTRGFAQRGYVGFDKNGYPGDELLPRLHRTFAFTGYWLNDPPGMQSNPWAGKREVVGRAGFGFLVLFNGRLDAQLKSQDAAALGRMDGAAAIGAARHEGFPRGTIIFLDQEEGGRLLPEQAQYVSAWIGAVGKSPYRAGVYCSGIPVGAGKNAISTAQDVAVRFPGLKLWFWDDRCPPSPGCVVSTKGSVGWGFQRAEVWQYAKSPREPQYTAGCGGYAGDGQCYAPGLAHSGATFLDLDVSASADPSHGRQRRLATASHPVK